MILSQFALAGPPWKTLDPFLFCVHHKDHYPTGNADMGIASPLVGRALGSDFSGKDGFSMYHGERVPGFPRHPHRGFETITLARRGFIDHSDSLGAKARFGEGDAQWMTAGKGIVHAEMFPLLQTETANPTELFQIWINLPSQSKMVPPYFTMLWNHSIPRVITTDDKGRKTELVAVAGHPDSPAPPPDSWASSDSDVAVWTITLSPGAHYTLPAAKPTSNRCLYYFVGEELTVAGQAIEGHRGLQVKADSELLLIAGRSEVQLLLLQGKPIAEPVAHYGPFVMNTSREIQQAITDYRRTEYGGWPWAEDDPVHQREAGRFAEHADGKHESF